MSSVELSGTLIDQINDAHRRVLLAFKQGASLLVVAANARRECGLLLLKLDEVTPHGEWLQHFRTAEGKSKNAFGFPFDAQTGRNYMKMAKAHPEPFITMDEVLRYQVAMGREADMLNSPDKGNPGNRSGLTFVSAILALSGRFESHWKKLHGEEELAKMSDEGRSQLAEQIKPIKERIDQIWSAVT